MLVDILDRQVLLLIQFPTLTNKLFTPIAAVDLPQPGTNNFIRLMLVVYPGKVIHEAVIESSNPKYNYICSFLQSNESAIIKITSEGVHFCV